MKKKDNIEWWKKEVIYQIYPRSFKDSNSDGVGDLLGIVQKLDYLKEMGVKVIWLSPIYPSPMADFGYDVSDYNGIHPLFGTMEDFDYLLREVHERDMKLLLDLVPNHSSDQHPWFLESRASRESAKRDWYIWKDPAPDGGPPNNWLSVFGGSAWELDKNTGQYYYHAFLKEQPDLNWRNPKVQKAMFDVMRYWLEKGVDGFRVDVMWHMIKDEQFRNNPPNPDYKDEMSPYDRQLPLYSTDQAEVHQIVTKMRRVMEEYGERLLIGEIYLPIERLVAYYGQNGEGAHLPFNFQLVLLPWNAREIERAINKYEASLPKGGWPNWVLGNHDNSRIASRVGKEQARIAAILLLTLRGTPTLYYGDEIGMENVPIPPEKVQDPQEINIPGKGLGRDPERTPMQWNGTRHAGFTDGEPWLPLMKNYNELNVENEKKNPQSLYALYRKLLKLRAQEPALQLGDYEPVYSEGNVLAYLRSYSGKRFLVALNLGSNLETLNIKLSNWKGVVRLDAAFEEQGKEVQGDLKIKGHQGFVIEIL